MTIVWLLLSLFTMQNNDLVRLTDRVGFLSGPTATDCGMIWANAQEVDFAQAGNCVLDSVEEGKPFKLIIRFRNIESLIVNGLLGNSKGEVYRFSYDDSGVDTSGRSDYEVISTEPCNKSCVLNFLRSAVQSSNSVNSVNKSEER